MRDFNEYEPSKMYYSEVKEITDITKKEIEIGGRNGMSELWENALREERIEARAEGRTEGKAEGRTEGVTKGKAEGIQEMLSVVKEYKKGNITKEEAAKKLSISLEDFNVIAK